MERSNLWARRIDLDMNTKMHKFSSCQNENHKTNTIIRIIAILWEEEAILSEEKNILFP